MQDQTSSLQSTIESLNTRIFNLESERSRILGIVVTQHYEHVYGGWLWQDRYQWDLDIPLSLYCARANSIIGCWWSGDVVQHSSAGYRTAGSNQNTRHGYPGEEH